MLTIPQLSSIIAAYVISYSSFAISPWHYRAFTLLGLTTITAYKIIQARETKKSLSDSYSSYFGLQTVAGGKLLVYLDYFVIEVFEIVRDISK